MVMLGSILVMLSASLATVGGVPTAPTTGREFSMARGIGVGELARVQLYTHAQERLRECVMRAHEGALSQRELRLGRRAVEAALDGALRSCDAVLARGDRQRIEEARAAFNQSRMSSMEWEYFGPTPDPQWGWDPARQFESTGGVLLADSTLHGR